MQSTIVTLLTILIPALLAIAAALLLLMAKRYNTRYVRLKGELESPDYGRDGS